MSEPISRGCRFELCGAFRKLRGKPTGLRGLLSVCTNTIFVVSLEKPTVAADGFVFVVPGHLLKSVVEPGFARDARVETIAQFLWLYLGVAVAFFG